jgi:hypothetical protein
MAQPVARRQALDQGTDAGVDVLRKHAAGGPQPGVYSVAEGEHVRRRGRLVNGKAESREDCARLPARHGAGPRELQQGRSVEARHHDAEAPIEAEPDNVRSTRLAQRLGIQREGHLRDRLFVADQPRSRQMSRLLRSEWGG